MTRRVSWRINISNIICLISNWRYFSNKVIQQKRHPSTSPGFPNCWKLSPLPRQKPRKWTTAFFRKKEGLDKLRHFFLMWVSWWLYQTNMSIIEIMPRHFWYQKWRLFKQLAMKVASWHLEVAWILLCSSMLPHLVDQSLCFANPAGTVRPSIIQAQKASRLCSSYEDQWLWQLNATPMQHLKHLNRFDHSSVFLFSALRTIVSCHLSFRSYHMLPSEISCTEPSDRAHELCLQISMPAIATKRQRNPISSEFNAGSYGNGLNLKNWIFFNFSKATLKQTSHSNRKSLTLQIFHLSVSCLQQGCSV